MYSLDAMIGRIVTGLPGRLSDAFFGASCAGAGRAADRAGTPDRRATWIELRNKVHACRLFRFCGGGDELATIRAMDIPDRIFAAEGYAWRGRRRGVSLAALLNTGLNPVSIHAGAGLYDAQQMLKGVASGREAQVEVSRFFDEFRRSVLGGFAGIAEETLGFVTVALYPSLLDEISRAMAGAEKAARFWHGAGRAQYFRPRHMQASHSAPWRGIESCSAIAPSESGLQNMLSGFAFALALVNYVEPQVLECFVRHHGAEGIGIADGLAAGQTVGRISALPMEEMIAGNPAPELLFSVRQKEFSPFTKHSTSLVVTGGTR